MYDKNDPLVRFYMQNTTGSIISPHMFLLMAKKAANVHDLLSLVIACNRLKEKPY